MSAEERAAAARTRLIDHNLKMDRLKAKRDVKLLLLGKCVCVGVVLIIRSKGAFVWRRAKEMMR